MVGSRSLPCRIEPGGSDGAAAGGVQDVYRGTVAVLSPPVGRVLQRSAGEHGGGHRGENDLCQRTSVLDRRATRGRCIGSGCGGWSHCRQLRCCRHLIRADVGVCGVETAARDRAPRHAPTHDDGDAVAGLRATVREKLLCLVRIERDARGRRDDLHDWVARRRLSGTEWAFARREQPEPRDGHCPTPGATTHILSCVRFGSSTGVARRACGSLGALRPRFSPGLPLSPPRGGDSKPADLWLCDCRQKKPPAAREGSRVAGGRADVATFGSR